MKLEQQCCSLQQAKRLKELGVKQKSLFYWHERHQRPQFGERITDGVMVCNDKQNAYSAFTVAELGEMLPFKVSDNYTEIETLRVSNGFRCATFNVVSGKHLHYYERPTEAEARAAMLIHLIETGVVKP